MVMVIKNTIEASVPITSALAHPNVSFFVGSFRVILSAVIAKRKDSISVNKCAQSVKMAMELEIMAPVSWQVIKSVDTHITHFSCL